MGLNGGLKINKIKVRKRETKIFISQRAQGHRVLHSYLEDSGLGFRMCMIMPDAPALPFEVSFPPIAGLAYGQNQRKKGNLEP